MMKKYHGGLWCAAVLAAMVAPSWAKCEKPLKMTVAHSSPSMLIEADGSVKGAAIEALDAISKDSGCSIEYEVLPRARGVRSFMTGASDVLFGAKSADLEKNAVFIPVGSVRLRLIVKEGASSAPLAEKDLLAGKLFVNIVTNYDYGADYRALIEKLRGMGKIEEVYSVEQVLQKMATGRGDAAIMPATNFLDAQRMLKVHFATESVTLQSLPPIDFGFYLSTQSFPKQARDVFEKVMSERILDGVYWNSFLRNMPPIKTLAQDYRPVLRAKP